MEFNPVGSPLKFFTRATTSDSLPPGQTQSGQTIHFVNQANAILSAFLTILRTGGVSCCRSGRCNVYLPQAEFLAHAALLGEWPAYWKERLQGYLQVHDLLPRVSPLFTKRGSAEWHGLLGMGVKWDQRFSALGLKRAAARHGTVRSA